MRRRRLLKSLEPIPRTDPANGVPRTVRPSAIGALPLRDAHLQGGVTDGGLLGPAASPGGGVAARVEESPVPLRGSP